MKQSACRLDQKLAGMLHEYGLMTAFENIPIAND
jgi:hypothetical protein